MSIWGTITFWQTQIIVEVIMRNGLTFVVVLGVLLPAAIAMSAATHAREADVPNVVYGMHGGLALLMDVCEPAEVNGHALLLIPGSAFHAPTGYDAKPMKDYPALPPIVDSCLNLGFTVFVINHRVAPLFRYPAPLDDVRRAARFIRHHAEDYGVTSDRLAAFGLSSGGHLALMLALADAEGDPEASDPVDRASARVDVVAAIAAPSNLASKDWLGTVGGQFITSFMGAPFVPGAIVGPHIEASPANHVSNGDPPVLLAHGDADPLVPVAQARLLDEILRDHGVEVEYIEVPGGGHGSPVILNVEDQDTLPSPHAIARWLRDHLSGADGSSSASQ
jgi:acetyl esterase/lipase